MSQQSLRAYFASRAKLLEQKIPELAVTDLTSLRVEVENVGTWNLTFKDPDATEFDDFIWMSETAATELVADPRSVLKSIRERKMIISRPDVMIVVFNQLYPGQLGIELPGKLSEPISEADVATVRAFFEHELIELLRANDVSNQVKQGTYVFDVTGVGEWSVLVGPETSVSRGSVSSSVSTFMLDARVAAGVISDPNGIFGFFSAGTIQVSNPCRAVRFIEHTFAGSFTDHLPEETKLGLFPERYKKTPAPDDETLARGTRIGITYFVNDGKPYPVSYADVDGLAVVEGDVIIGSVEEVEHIREVVESGRWSPLSGVRIVDPSDRNKYVWPNGIVPYDFGNVKTDRARIQAAIAEINEYTNVTFVRREAQDDYVLFVHGKANLSSVGYQGEEQTVSLTQSVATGTIIHELGHVVGLWHEHNRTDRDTYVDVIFDNIKDDAKQYFEKRTASESENIGDYDYESIMHYGRSAGSKNKKETIIPADSKAQIGQRNGLSAGDIEAINSIYRI